MKIDYLRISVTDWCNLNCVYCTPLEKSQFLGHQEVLRYEEIIELAKIFVKAGISKIKLTGGEPLIKKGIVNLIKMLKEVKGVNEVSMTTNGVLLSQYAAPLKKAGLDRINISLDTLKPERFLNITGKDYFRQVYDGIESALTVGFDSVKLNVVPMRSINNDEILDFVKLTFKRPLVVRFIEFFHTNQRSKKLMIVLIPSEEIKRMVTAKFGKLSPVSEINGSGPAKYYRLEGASGALGFISGSTDNFCCNCNRLRLDCAGRISPCLFSGFIYDTRKYLRSQGGKTKLLEEIKHIISSKILYTKNSVAERKIEMSSLGG